MSSLLQFDGKIGPRGVRLEFVHVVPPPPDHPDRRYFKEGSTAFCRPDEMLTCTVCGKSHARIYTAWRKPVGTFGCWVVFRYNGEEQVPDLSVPIDVMKLPRDAKPMTPDQSSAAWHRS